MYVQYVLSVDCSCPRTAAAPAVLLSMYLSCSVSLSAADNCFPVKAHIAAAQDANLWPIRSSTTRQQFTVPLLLTSTLIIINLSLLLSSLALYPSTPSPLLWYCFLPYFFTFFRFSVPPVIFSSCHPFFFPPILSFLLYFTLSCLLFCLSSPILLLHVLLFCTSADSYIWNGLNL